MCPVARTLSGLRNIAALLAFLSLAGVAGGQTSTRRLTTIDALRQFPGFYHLQTVVLRGEFADNGTRIMLRADEHELRVLLADGVSTTRGLVEVRGQLIDVGRLEREDPRAAGFAEGRDAERWPRPGEELFLRITSVAEAPPPTSATVRAIALEPWRYLGQKVTVLGNFRGRNLFGDLAGGPGKSPHDFVIRGAEGAIWVTGLRPRGRGFDLDVNRRVDSDRWVEVSGTVTRERGLVSIEATQITAAKAPELTAAPDTTDAPLPPPPVEVIFSSPTADDIDVMPAAPIRIQFSRGLDEKSLAGRIRVTYVGGGPDQTTQQFKAAYDAANRALLITFAQPLERFRTIRIELLEGIKAFDGGPLAPWSLTFSVGG